MLKNPLSRILVALTFLLALVLDELWQMGRLHEWSWKWIVALIVFGVLLTDLWKVNPKT
jgi:hypothetical protein